MDTLSHNVQCNTRFPKSNLADQLLKGIARDLGNHPFVNEQETQGDKFVSLINKLGYEFRTCSPQLSSPHPQREVTVVYTLNSGALSPVPSTET